MKKLIKHVLATSLFVMGTSAVVAQSVGVGTANPDPSAALHIAGTGQGLLIPQTDTAAVTGPATGLIVFQPSNGSFYYYSGTNWEEIITSLNLEGDDLGSHIAEDHVQMSGYWISNDADKEGIYITANGNVGIGNSGFMPNNFPNRMVVGGNMSIGEGFVGVTTPGNGLSVQGVATFGTPTPHVDGITIQYGNAPVGISQGIINPSHMELTTADASGNQAPRLVLHGAGDNVNVRFFRGGAGALTESMRIRGSDGFVGIGETTPAAMLDVRQEIVFTSRNASPVAAAEQTSIAYGTVDLNAFALWPFSNFIANIENVGLGLYVVNFVNGTFGDPPTVTVTTNDFGPTPGFAIIENPDPSGVIVRTFNAGGLPTNMGFNIIAVGRRGFN